MYVITWYEGRGPPEEGARAQGDQQSSAEPPAAALPSAWDRTPATGDGEEHAAPWPVLSGLFALETGAGGRRRRGKGKAAETGDAGVTKG